VAAEQAANAIDVVTETIRRRSFPGLLGIRYVKSSDASLAFTRFSPMTCTIEIPATAGDGALDVYEEIWQGLDRASIDFTLHWGQCMRLDPDWIRRAYGTGLDDWLAARRQWLGVAGRRMFSSDWLERLGIAD
jgi:hypothetical protein